MIILIFLVLLIFVYLLMIKKEYFDFPYPIMSPPKRNISYDLRCDPFIPRYYTGPFRESSIEHYYRPKCLVGL